MKLLIRIILASICLGSPLVIYSWYHGKMPIWFGNSSYGDNENAVRGQFGDQFGALNTAFSGVAAGALLLTLIFTLSQLTMLEKDREDARKDRKDDERIDAATLRLRAITSEIEIISSDIRISTVLFHEADARCLKNPGDSFAISERESHRATLAAHRTNLQSLLADANTIRKEFTQSR
jgi:hypothetical protein